MERAIERDSSIQVISAEINQDEEQEDPRGSMDEVERDNAEFESERQFDKFVSEDD